MVPQAPVPGELVREFEDIGVTAFTTTRAGGDFNLADPGTAGANTRRWLGIHAGLESYAPGLVCARQVHGAAIAEHRAEWSGWLRIEGVDGHLVTAPRGAAAVTIADCVPVFLAKPDGMVAIVHAGWRGTAAQLVPAMIERMAQYGAPAHEIHVHLGPAICGRCYEVGPDVYRQLTGYDTVRNRHVDLRALLAEQAKESGVLHVSASAFCTKCDNDRFFSHRAGDAERQIAVIAATPR
ncbi:MAG: polyphenol oxidase family protein [Gemmatimonadetes bacterium]|nr:polyphenol oxidase family protein [Gemmatimonadota bacterium]